MTKFNLTLGCDLDKWYGYGEKLPISTDISPNTNSHILLSGMSGSAKTSCENALLAKLILAEQEQGGEYYFADYKGDDLLAYLRGCSRYFSYKNTLDALDIVYNKLCARLSGEDKTRNPVTLIWDEYMANIAFLLGQDKANKTKTAEIAMGKISEILMLGRSMSVRYFCSVQRPDAVAFPLGSRLNYGVIMVLGAATRSIYEMLLPDHMEQTKEREFNAGEGVLLLRGSKLHFIKIPFVNDVDKMRQICIGALS